MAIDFDFKDPRNQKLIISFLIPIVILYAFYRFVIEPKIMEVKTVKNEITEIESQIKIIGKKIKSKDLIMEEKNKLLKQLSELEALLPEEENVSLLLEQFSMVERDAKVYIVGFNAAESTEGAGKPYRENKYQMTIEAGYHQFAMFMSKVMSLPRVFSLSNLRISRNPMASEKLETFGGLEDQPRYLTIECTITSYVYTGVNNTGNVK